MSILNGIDQRSHRLEESHVELREVGEDGHNDVVRGQEKGLGVILALAIDELPQLRNTIEESLQ